MTDTSFATEDKLAPGVKEEGSVSKKWIKLVQTFKNLIILQYHQHI
jgi:hypothetical protein